LLGVGIFPQTLFAAEENTGWLNYGRYFQLYINGKKTFDTYEGDNFRIPNNLSEEDEIDHILFLSEYLTIKNKTDQIQILLNYVNTKDGNNYKLLSTFVEAVSFLKQGEDQEAERILKSYIGSERDPYLSSIANLIWASFFKEKDSYKNQAIKTSCLRKKPYYSLCRLFKLEIFLDDISGSGLELHKQYLNILRVLSPFLEEENSLSIPYLNLLDPELPAKLGFLGFAKEAIYFQKMILEFEKLEGRSQDISWERLSYLYLLTKDLKNAEQSLLMITRESKNRKITFLNRIYFKLGLIAFMNKDYDKSIEYYLQVDFKDWSGGIHNPIQNESLTVQAAKDLIAVSVWESRKNVSAVKALMEIPMPERFNQEDFWPRLRIAQIMMEDKPELAAKWVDEIIYNAQEKGWKRLEYSATILQGYIQILVQQFRKATIEFTKARGILSEADRAHGSSFVQNSGMVMAHQASGKKADLLDYIVAAINAMKNQYTEEEFLVLKNYKPRKEFSNDKFINTTIQYLKDKNDAPTILELLHLYNQKKPTLEDPNTYSIQQIFYTNRLMTPYGGFFTPRDEKYLESNYSKVRELEAQYLNSDIIDIRNKSLAHITSPFIAVYPLDDSLYIVSFDPRVQNRSLAWQVEKVDTENYEGIMFRASIRATVESFKEVSHIQVYFNKQGLSVADYIKRNFPKLYPSLFYTYSPYKGKIPNDPLPLVVWDPEGKNTFIKPGVYYSDRNLFEGQTIKPFEDQEKVSIWNFDYLRNRPSQLPDYIWTLGDENNRISFRRIARRVDFRTIPHSLIFTEKILDKSFFEQKPSYFFDFVGFWLKNGVSEIYYFKKLPTNPDDLANLLNPISTKHGVGNPEYLWESMGDMGYVFTREIR
jgi:hypothetical protein